MGVTVAEFEKSYPELYRNVYKRALNSPVQFETDDFADAALR